MASVAQNLSMFLQASNRGGEKFRSVGDASVAVGVSAPIESPDRDVFRDELVGEQTEAVQNF